EKQGWAALLEAARQQAAAVAGQDPAGRFLRLLAAAISSGRAHLIDRGGGRPASPELWGWREREATGTHPPEGHPEGSCVGWLDDKGVYLDPEAAYAEVQSLGDAQGERLPLTQTQLYKQLKEAGHLASFEKDKTTSRQTLQGRRRAVLHLPLGVL